MITVVQVVNHLRQIAPLDWAADWDNVGLLLGDRESPVERIMTCLTITPETVAEAIEEKANLIVTHHPVFFRPAKNLTTETAEGRLLWPLAKNGIAVYSAHTAWDDAVGGINDQLAKLFEMKDVTPLRPPLSPGGRGQGERRIEGRKQCKVVVFVPEADWNRVADAMFSAGAGNIGQYSQCSFRLSGTGTFFGSDSTNPTIGEKGRREEVSEWRLEAVCPEDAVDRVVAAMRAAHSYEEPAYDVYSLRPPPSGNGTGRIGALPEPQLLQALAEKVKDRLKATGVQLVGDPARKIQRLAIVCGAGGGFLNEAVRQKADALLTGEMRFHDCLAAQAEGLSLVLPGHYATERFGMEELARRLQNKLADLFIWPSRRERDPLLLC